MSKDDIAVRRARLAALETELARLRGRHDVLLSAFKFEEAQALATSIATHEAERRSLAETLPPAPEAASRPYSVDRRRRRRR